MTDDFDPVEKRLAEVFGELSAPAGVSRYRSTVTDAGDELARGRIRRVVSQWMAVIAIVTVAAVAAFGLRGFHFSTAASYATPPARSEAAMAYDPNGHVVLLFGGISGSGQPLADTWSWDGKGWTQLHPAHSPQARSGAAMGFDTHSGDLILTGGFATAPQTVTNACHITAAGGSVSGSISVTGGSVGAGTGSLPGHVSMSATSSVGVAAGGDGPVTISGSGTSSSGCIAASAFPAQAGDTWIWNGSDWTDAHTKAPGAGGVVLQTAHLVTTSAGELYALYDSVTPPILASPQCATNTVLNAQACPALAPQPSARCSTAPSGSQTTPPTPLTCASASFAPTTHSDELAVWRDGAWAPVSAAGGAPPTMGTVFADPLSGEVDAVDFSQFCSGGSRGYSLTTSGGKVTQSFGCGICTANAKPALNASTTGITTAIAGGGCTPATSRTEVTLYQFDGRQWSQRALTGLSVPVLLHATTDTSRHQVIALDGDGHTWTWSGGATAWTKLATTDAPASLGGAAMAFDADNDRVVLFGGVTLPASTGITIASGQTSNQTWVWDSTAWNLAGGSLSQLPLGPAIVQTAIAPAPCPPPGTVANGGITTTGGGAQTTAHTSTSSEAGTTVTSEGCITAMSTPAG